MLALPAMPAQPGLGPFGAAPVPGFGLPPAPPPSKKKGTKTDPLDVYYERWLDLAVEPFAAQAPMDAGTVVEIATTDATGIIGGTALLMVRQKYPPDAWGVFLESSLRWSIVASAVRFPAARLQPGLPGGHRPLRCALVRRATSTVHGQCRPQASAARRASAGQASLFR